MSLAICYCKLKLCEALRFYESTSREFTILGVFAICKNPPIPALNIS